MLVESEASCESHALCGSGSSATLLAMWVWPDVLLLVLLDRPIDSSACLCEDVSLRLK